MSFFSSFFIHLKLVIPTNKKITHHTIITQIVLFIYLFLYKIEFLLYPNLCVYVSETPS